MRTAPGTGVDTPRGFAPELRDPRLDHQLTFHWASLSKREVKPTCNCGWVGLRRRPEVLGAVAAMTTDYQRHCR